MPGTEKAYVPCLLSADTTGLLPPDADDKHHVTYVCEMRKQTPFHLTKTRKQVLPLLSARRPAVCGESAAVYGGDARISGGDARISGGNAAVYCGNVC